MEYSLVAPRAFVLKLKIHCKECEKDLKRFLQRIEGVHSVEINAKQGNITIKGTINPPTIMLMLENYGRKAELLWEQTPTKDGDQSLQIIAESKVIDQFDDPKLMEKLQKLSGIKDLNVEVTITKTFKITSNGGKEKIIVEEKDLEVSTKDKDDTVYNPQLFHGNRHRVASASCCGGGHHCCHINNPTWNWPPPACGCRSPLEPAPSWPVYNSSAPPELIVYNVPPTPTVPPPPPPPPQSNSYVNMFSDDNATGCRIM